MTTERADPIQLVIEVLESFDALAEQYFKCPVCLEIMSGDSYIIPECMHRFCGDCIKKSIRVCKNQCPECRTAVSTQRSLRVDNNFNDFVSTINSY